MGKNATIQALWENSGHGTRLEDVQAAYEAGQAFEREACAKVAEVALRHYTGAVTGVAEAIRARSNA